MTLGLCFYIIMLVWLFFGVGPVLRSWPEAKANREQLLLFTLLLILGWAVFGSPIK